MAKIIQFEGARFSTEYEEGYSLRVVFKHTPDLHSRRLELVYDFSHMTEVGHRKNLTYWIIEGYKSWAADKSAASRKEVFQHLKLFYQFLMERRHSIVSLNQLHPTDYDLYQGWLREWAASTGKENSSYKAWKAINLITGELLDGKVPDLHPAITRRKIRRSAVGDSAVFKKKQNEISLEEIGRIEGLCRRLADEYAQTWEESSRLIADAHSSGFSGILPPPEDAPHLGFLLAHYQYHWRKTGARGVCEDGRRLRTVEHAPALAERFGVKGTPDIYWRFQPNLERLLPFLILILIKTGGNPDPIYGLHRNCLQAPEGASDVRVSRYELAKEVNHKRETIHFYKKRSSKWMSRSYPLDQAYSPPVIVKKVLRYTEDSRLHAPDDCRNRLWLFYWSSCGVTLAREGNVGPATKKFIEKHGLPKFSPRSFRVPYINSAIRRTESIAAGQDIAGHSDISTTRKHYLSGIGRGRIREVIARLQSEMHQWVRQEKQSYQKDHDFKDDEENLYVSWASMFSDFRFRFEGSVEKAARMLQVIAHLERSRLLVHAARWSAIYDPLLHMCYEIKGMFASSSMDEAAKLVPMFDESIPLPPIE